MTVPEVPNLCPDGFGGSIQHLKIAVALRGHFRRPARSVRERWAICLRSVVVNRLQFVDLFAQPLPLKKPLGKTTDGCFWGPKFGTAVRVRRDHLNRSRPFALDQTEPPSGVSSSDGFAGLRPDVGQCPV